MDQQRPAENGKQRHEALQVHGFTEQEDAYERDHGQPEAFPEA